MKRFFPSLDRLFTSCLVLTLGLFGLDASVGQAQIVPKPAIKPSQLQKKEPIDTKPYVTRPNYPLGDLMASLNERVRKYAESMLGKQVGNGECWTLVNAALNKAGAKQPGQGGYGTYVFGKEVALKDVKPGDILQFENVVFKHTNPNGSSYTNNFPHHTAIVNKVQGRQIDLLHQNVNGNRTVQTGTINLDHKQPGGTLLGYRPQPR
jgi:hypothetical protein